MAQWLRGLILSGDLGSIPSTQMAAHSCPQLTVLGDLPPLPCFSRNQVCRWHTDVHADKTPVHMKEIQFVKECAATTSHHVVHFISFFLGTGSSLSLGLMAGEPGLGSKLDSVDGDMLTRSFSRAPFWIWVPSSGSSELSHARGRSWLGTDLSSSCLASALS